MILSRITYIAWIQNDTPIDQVNSRDIDWLSHGSSKQHGYTMTLPWIKYKTWINNDTPMDQVYSMDTE